jgi:hypothetical protein
MPSDRRRKRRIREADAMFEECRAIAAKVGLDLGKHDVGQYSLEWPVTRARWELYPSTQRIYINTDRRDKTPMLHMPPGAWTLKSIVEKAIEVLQLSGTSLDVPITRGPIGYYTRLVPKKVIDNGDGTYEVALPAPPIGSHIVEVDLSFAKREKKEETEDNSACPVAFTLERAVAAVQLMADHYFTTVDTLGPGELCEECSNPDRCDAEMGEPCPAFIAAEERFKKFEPVREFVTPSFKPADVKITLNDIPITGLTEEEVSEMLDVEVTRGGDDARR